jgi:hypothetical protein
MSDGEERDEHNAGEGWKNNYDDHNAGEEWKPAIKRMMRYIGKFFALKGETIVNVTDDKAKCEAFDIKNRRIGFKDFGNDTYISTVFLCIDHSFGDSETPILFETMAWYKGKEYECRRYPTVEAAMTGHREVLESLEVAVRNNI